jgi:hypothetical protein
MDSPAGSSNRTLRPLILLYVLFIPLTAPIPTHTVTYNQRWHENRHDRRVCTYPSLEEP